MAYQMVWTHQHVIHESRQIVTGYQNQIKVRRTYRQTVISICPYGFNCPIAYPNRFVWPTPHPNPLMSQHMNPQFSSLPQPPRQHKWLSNDLYEFNTPASAFQSEMIKNVGNVGMNRSWDYIGHSKHLYSYNTMRIKLMSYNVLSQNILDAHQLGYQECREEDLVWEARWEKIFNEVVALDPDIFCLQEVQVTHLAFYARFQAIGYMGVFKKKTLYKGDGCAVFYKCSVFEMIERTSVEFRCDEIPFLRANSVGIIMKLALHASPNTHIVVATTHLRYLRGETATRLAQMRILLNEIEKFSYDEFRGQLPLVLAGDFNEYPSSNLIKFLEEGQIRIPVEESLESIGFSETNVEMNWVQVNGVNGDSAATQQTYKLVRHPLKLSSVYGKGHGRCATVDYIYYTDDLNVVERLAPPATCMRRKIPNETYGSDHMSIAAVFEMII